MNSINCSKCAQSFATPAKLAVHMRRKTACVPGVPGETGLNTFIQLYTFLAGFPGESIIPWLESAWKGKDKQESLLRIFAFLGVIPEFDGYTVCTGNFNMGNITPVKNIRDLFYHPTGGAIMLKDSGDASDLTLRLDDTIIVTTSKNFAKYTVNKLDITKIKDGCNNPAYVNTRQRLCIVIRRRDQFMGIVTNAKKTSAAIVAYINDPTTIILDWVDLDNAFRRFKTIYSHRLIDSIFDTDMPRQSLALRPHQIAAVAETKIIKESGATDALWGHVPRSGKSYIMAAFIADDAKCKDTCNYLIITTAPNETIEQYESILRCEDLRGVNVLRLPRDSAENLGAKNIIICSKQYLQTKFDVADVAPPSAPAPKKGSKSKALPPKQNRSQKCMYSWLSVTPKIKVVPELAWLAALSIDARFVDESHLGGSTDLAQQTLTCFGSGKFTVFITATYSKPADAYAIPRNRWVTWDLDDIAACKQFASPCADTVARAQSRIFDKHPHSVNIFKQCDPAYIAATYNTYPELTILTHEITDDVIAEMRASADNTYGWSAKACLLLKQSAQTGKVARVPEFQNEPETVKMIHTLFGAPPDTFGRRRLGAKSFMERAADICNNANADPRFMRDPRAFPDTDPTIIIAFLPAMDIDTTSTALQNLIERRGLLPEYDICIINSKQSGDPKTRIESARALAKNAGKRAVLVLSGRQCSLGVTLHGCDVAILLNATDDNDGSDMIYQMMFRSMTEAVGKKYGFVFDMDIQRAMRTVVCNQTHPVLKDGKTYREFVAYLLRERIVSLNPDHWEPRFGHSPAIREPFFARVYLAYSAQPDRIIKDMLDCVKLKSDLLTRNNCALLRAFGKLTKKSVKRVAVRVMREKRDSTIPDGIEKTAIGTSDNVDTESVCDGDDADDADEDDDGYNGLSPDEMIRHIIPTIVLLTIDKHTTTLRQMITEIEKDKHIWEILMDRTRAWWEHLGTREMLFLLIGIHEEHITSIDRTVDMTIDYLKDVFVEHIDCAAKLSGVIDNHLVPLETEKKAHAEVSTPAALRREMLDTIPAEFWTKPRRVLEPCAGKGGFLVDIVDRFMRGLEPSIPDADERRRVIVEECLYWADINPFNVWVCSFLLNLKGKYKLNGYLGDSLTLDVATQWGITGGFDAVVGNPPYSTDPSLKDTRPLYNIFVEKYIDIAQYLLFVIPSRWFVGGKGLDEFREFMTKRTDIALITHEDNATKWFGSCVDIKGGTHYFLKDSTYNGLCLFNGVPYMLSKYDCVIKPQHHILVDKCAIIPSIDLLYCSSQHFKYRNNDPAVKSVGNTVCFVSTLKSKNRKQYVSDFVFNDVNTFWKVLTLRAAHKAFSGFGAIFVARPDEVYTDSYFAFKVPDETSANSLVSYLQTAFANHMLSIRKISHNTSKDTCKWIPLVPLDRIWTDALVCDHFGIDPASYMK